MKQLFGWRDLLAFPFLALAMTLDKIALCIGGIWTAQLLLKKYVKK